jgi:hypothetical protein
MNEKDITWLTGIFPVYRDKVMKGSTLQAYYEAERLLLNLETIKKRGCSCDYKQMQQDINKLYDEWQTSRST